MYRRADGTKEFMGMTNCKCNLPIKSETEIVKNYLKEINVLEEIDN